MTHPCILRYVSTVFQTLTSYSQIYLSQAIVFL